MFCPGGILGQRKRIKTVNLCSRLLEDPGLFAVVHPHSSCVDSPRSLMVCACVRMLAGPFARGLHTYVTIHREI